MLKANQRTFKKQDMADTVRFFHASGLRLPLAAWAVQWLANVDQDGSPLMMDAVTELIFDGDESKAIQLMDRVQVARQSPNDFGVESLGDIIENVALTMMG